MTQQRNVPASAPARDPAPTPQELDLLRAIRDLSFGTVEITVHNARIVQITRSEKRRYE
jgi:hypothetical protein